MRSTSAAFEAASASTASPSAQAPGRVCPLRYRYGPAAIARADTRRAETLYVVGGLYGNLPALDAIETMVRTDHRVSARPPVLCFNGDFNWFNIDDRAFAQINLRVLANDAILGNVEAELGAWAAEGVEAKRAKTEYRRGAPTSPGLATKEQELIPGGAGFSRVAADDLLPPTPLDTPADDAGCGCAYPDSVDAGVVERSNQIHARLKATARRHADLLNRIARLPMVARYRVADCRIGVVHGDAESLAGWRFDVNALDDPAQRPWQNSAFELSEVDVFASTHTCLPALRQFRLASGRTGGIVNNGAAGMPNFTGDLSGLCTRIATTPSPHAVLQEVRVAGAWIALLPVHFDTQRWQQEFLAQWPPGSPAWQSYFQRICQGPAFSPAQALAGLAR